MKYPPGHSRMVGDYIFDQWSDVGLGTDPGCRLHIKASGVGGSNEKTFCIEGGDVYYNDSSPTIHFIMKNGKNYWRIGTWGGCLQVRLLE
ncbi:MAG: hypothetical protein B6U97_01420 [Candidatus Altiarchaeales archaeon ex4484_96]|nr:MAG: hypothetical protein B6U97_01420 [Candidatus Altiarchaeales archaeon ex4484_96]